MIKLDARSWGFIVVAVLASSIFVRLGVWQLDRLAERRARNADHAALTTLPPLEVSEASRVPPTDSLLWRRVRLTGTLDFENEIIIRARAAYGSPGVYVVTPLRFEGGPAVLVLRGWLPAADGLSADVAAARPGSDKRERSRIVQITGQARPGESPASIPARRKLFDDREHLVLGRLDIEAAESGLGESLVNAWILPDSSIEVGGEITPRSVTLPPPSDGPHLLYAIQWFSFAAITVAGAVLFIFTRRREGSERSSA